MAVRPTLRDCRNTARDIIGKVFPRWQLMPQDDAIERYLTFAPPIECAPAGTDPKGTDPGTTLWCIARRTGEILVRVEVIEPKGSDGLRLRFMVPNNGWPQHTDGSYRMPPADRNPSITVDALRPAADLAADVTRRFLRPFLDTYATLAVESDDRNCALDARVRLITDLMTAAGTEWPGDYATDPHNRREEMYSRQQFHPGPYRKGKPTLCHAINVGSAGKDANKVVSVTIETKPLSKERAIELLTLLGKWAAEDGKPAPG